MTDYRTARGWISLPEREALKDYASACASAFEDAKILNIGVEYGASLHCLREGAPEAELYGIDLNTKVFEGDDTGAIMFEGDSHGDEAADALPSGYGLVFLDADHTEEGLDADIKLWARRIRKGGYLLFHDYSDWVLHEGVVAAVDSWYDRVKTWEFIEQVDTLRVYRKK